MADAFVIMGTIKLCCENAGTGTGAEDTQVEHKNQTVDNGNTAHGHGADLTYHDVVQHGHKIGDSRLNDDGHSNPKNAAIEGFVANITIFHKNLKKVWSVEGGVWSYGKLHTLLQNTPHNSFHGFG